MYEGKLDVVKNEMKRINIGLLSISELKWKGNGHFKSETHMVSYSGHDAKRSNGVTIICGKEVAKTVMCYKAISDRIIALRFQGKETNYKILQI